MKLFIYTTNIEETLRGDFAWSLSASSRDDLADVASDWYLIGEIEFDMNLDRESLTKEAVSNIDKQIKDVRAQTSSAIALLESRQQNLLALTND